MKFSWKRAVCAAASVMLLSSSAAAAESADVSAAQVSTVSAEAVYEQAAQHMAAHPEGNYVIQMNMNMPFVGSVAAKTTLDMQVDPKFAAQSQTELNILGKSYAVQGYAEQQGNILHLYYGKQDEGAMHWKHREETLKSDAPIGKTAAGKKRNVMAGVKAVTPAGTGQYKVVFDASRLYTDADKAEWKQKGLTDQQIAMLSKVLQALQQAGDVTAVVTIDGQTQRISRVVLPLTPQLRTAVQAAFSLSSLSEADKAIVSQFVQYSDMSLQIDCRDLPSHTVIAVPDEVRRQAENSISAH
ncbi:hypothetical protein [uncultured Megasphaera sp.]|uniref:hypothetical protein n=1 Tax=uncultured Megasphaera sp. TaxID=165188 RepID=UPI002658CE94|nr:hypothetical protein [uncultured Megasphaera sp.]